MVGAALLAFGVQAAHADSMAATMPAMHAMAPTAKFAFGEPGNPAKADREVKVTMRVLSFEPSSIAVKAGETIRFVVTNRSPVDHEFTLGDAATEAAHRKEMVAMLAHGGAMHHDDDPNAVAVKPGQTAELTWRFDRPGKVEFDCNVPGHYEAGMRGAITVMR